MKEVNTRKKYKCDFCRRVSTKKSMIEHEKICFNNPKRYCKACENEGYYNECIGDLIYNGDCGLNFDIVCPYCSQDSNFDWGKVSHIKEGNPHYKE